MNVKIYTKEKFTVIMPEDEVLSVNMTEAFTNIINPYLTKAVPHLILNLKNVASIDEPIAETIARLQQQFYENNCSFVICEIQKPVEILLDEIELLELLNVTPTESEAWDILQMEEIERELLNDDDENDTSH